ncbi:calcium channel protein, partial [Linderina pennispora]
MLLLLIPCAILAHNMWYDMLFACNDDSVDGRAGCIGEYFDSDLGILIPRIWENPRNYNFDTFGSALSILFTAISNEGWTDVLSDTMAIRGVNLQPRPNHSWWNSLWWVAYIFFATIFILYIFIGIIVASYTQRTGTAFLTTEQRRWLDLKIQLRGTHPPTLPRTLQKKGFRRWCFMASIKTNTWYSRTLTAAALANCIVLLTVYRDRSTEIDKVQKCFRYASYIVFVLDFGINMAGMGVRATLRNANYQLLILCGVIIILFEFMFTTLGATSLGSVMLLYKLMLISDTLNELTRMIIGGFRPILILFWVWMVMTLIFALLTVELWGLTRAGPETSAHANFWSFLPAFLTLLRFSYGENWNYLITDLQVQYPHCVQSYNGNYLQTDCGLTGLAYLIFFTYNLVSMYIFVNVFIGVVTDNFQYCYQSSSSYKLLTRQEIRQFRITWWRFDPEGTGYIPREKYAAFFSKLKPPFNVGMYGDRLKLKHLVKALKRPPHGNDKVVHVEIDRMRYTHGNFDAYTHLGHDNEPLQYDLNITELEHCLQHADPYQMMLNRREFNRIYQEALLIDDPKRGMGFTQMLVFLARKKMVDPATAFLVEETLRYNDLAEQVDEVLRQKFVESVIISSVRRRKFLTAMKLHRRLQGLQSCKQSPRVPTSMPHPILHQAEDGPPIPLVRVHQPELRVDTTGIRCPAISNCEPLSPPAVSISLSPDPVPERLGTQFVVCRSMSTTLEQSVGKDECGSQASHSSSLPS